MKTNIWPLEHVSWTSDMVAITELVKWVSISWNTIKIVRQHKSGIDTSHTFNMMIKNMQTVLVTCDYVIA